MPAVATAVPTCDFAVDWILTHARLKILAVARADSCIYSTKIAVGVLRKVGLPARPFATRVVVFNPALLNRIKAYKLDMGQPPPAQLVKAWQFDETNGWALGIGYGAPAGRQPRGGGYDGHLVAIGGNATLVDLSIDQANRPEKQIYLQPLASWVSPAFLAGEAGWAITTPSGCEVRYEAHDNNEWMRSKDWNMRNRSDTLISMLAADLLSAWRAR